MYMYTILFALLAISIPLSSSRSFRNDDEELDGNDFTYAQRQFQREALRAHNKYRSRHCAPPLSLDDELSRSAQAFAEQLARANTLRQGRTDGAGQNLYTKFSSASVIPLDGEEPIEKWYEGSYSYDFDRGSFSSDTGSFTQLVWKKSQRLGVGIAYTRDGRSAYVVARYYPAGNFLGQFEKNVFSTEC